MKRYNCYSKITVAVGLIFLIGFLPGVLYAHGVSWEISSKKSYGIEFSYDDNTPMAYAEVKVFGPDDLSKLSQVGRADKNGYFAFIPDADGQWLITAEDGAGHMAKAEFPIALAASKLSGAPADDAAGSCGSSDLNLPGTIKKATKPFKIALVVSILINLGLIAVVCKRKKTV